MTEKLQQTIKEEIAQLPKEGQEAVNAVDWVKLIEEIGNENGLNQEEIEDFQLETLLVLIGVVDPEFYAINIENHVETTKEQSELLAKEAFQKVFFPIKETLEENIKTKMKNINPNWQQTLNFIVSGGDYSTFLENKDDSNNIPTTSKTDTLGNGTKINDIKNKFNI